MDPSSVSASVIGVLGAAAKISSALGMFVHKTRAGSEACSDSAQGG